MTQQEVVMAYYDQLPTLLKIKWNQFSRILTNPDVKGYSLVRCMEAINARDETEAVGIYKDIAEPNEKAPAVFIAWFCKKGYNFITTQATRDGCVDYNMVYRDGILKDLQEGREFYNRAVDFDKYLPFIKGFDIEKFMPRSKVDEGELKNWNKRFERLNVNIEKALKGEKTSSAFFTELKNIGQMCYMINQHRSGRPFDYPDNDEQVFGMIEQYIGSSQAEMYEEKAIAYEKGKDSQSDRNR